MRNFTSAFQSSATYRIDFLSEDLESIRSKSINLIVTAMQTSLDRLTPSEESSLDSFRDWFLHGSAYGTTRSGNLIGSYSAKQPSLVWIYVNCNTGINVAFIGLNNHGYGDYDLPGEELI